MKETDFFAKLRPHFNKWGEYDRVENVLASGMSDIFYNFNGTTGWIETKIAKGRFIYFEKFQLPWIGKHYRMGFRRMFTVVLDLEDAIRVYRADKILSGTRVAQGKWTTIDMDEIGPPDLMMQRPWKDWNSLLNVLTS